MYYMPRNEYNHLQLIEIVDEVLKLLPITKPKFSNIKSFSNVPDIRREQRVDANGLKTRRSKGGRKRESWVDVQTNKNETKSN